MSELERLVVLIFAALADSKQTDEMKALAETIDARCETAREYHRTRRGVHALERYEARSAKREVDYPAADKAAAGTLKAGEL